VHVYLRRCGQFDVVAYSIHSQSQQVVQLSERERERQERERALQRGLVMAKSGKLELADNILSAL